MKLKSRLQATTDSSVYKKLRRLALFTESRRCHYCPPHGGCNRSKRQVDKNWKKHRKNQYRQK